MRHNLKYIIFGFFAFLVATVATSVIGAIVNSAIPNRNKPDPPGKLDPDPNKPKPEYLQQLEAGGPKVTTENKTTETKPTETTTQSDPTPAPQPVPAPAPVRQTGPGNYDAPPVYSPPPAYPTGPGNM